MTVDNFFEELDSYFAENRISEVEAFLRSSIDLAKATNDLSLLLSAQNELVGYLRSVSNYSEAISIGREAMEILKSIGMENSIHTATTMLNTATAMRGAKMYEECIRLYEGALSIYDKNLEKNDYRIAGLFNNMSIVYENLSEYSKAKECVLKAIEIISKCEGAYIEEATSYINLAQIEFIMNNCDDGEKAISKAMKIFEINSATEDTHYSGALSTIAQSYYIMGDTKKAKMYYKLAMENVKRVFGENEYYDILKENYELINEQEGQE